MLVGQAWAYDFEYNGLYYNITSNPESYTHTVEVTYEYENGGGYYWYTTVDIPTSAYYNGDYYDVTSIGYHAFYNCNLTSITIPNSVTSIGESAFYDCKKITSLTIPNSVTTIGYNAFNNVKNVVYFGRLNNDYSSPWGALTLNGTIDGDFIYSDSTKTNITAYIGDGSDVVIPNSVTNICKEVFRDLDNSKYNEYENAYYLGNSENPYLCLVKAKSTSISSCEINEKCKYICGSAFNYCRQLTSITLPNTLISIGNEAFYYCNTLISIAIPESVKYIGHYAFYDCEKITSIVVPNSVSSIGDCAFSGCKGLSSISIPESVTSIGQYAFNGCSSLTSFVISSDMDISRVGLYFIKDDIRYKVLNKNAVEVVANSYSGDVVIPDTVRNYGCSFSVISIQGRDDNNYNGAFSNCSTLTSVTIPNSITTIGNYTFANCNNLVSISIPNSVTTIGQGAFDNCSNLDYNVFDYAYYIGNEENPYLVLMRSKRTTITNCNIHDDCKFIYDKAFYQCNAISSIFIPNSVVSIGNNAFEECSITTISLPNSVVNIGNNAFEESSLTTISIPNSVINIGKYAFRDCKDLTSVTIGDSVISIGENAFSNCSKLASINIPNGVTRINDYTFSNCCSLSAITIPQTVIYIGYEAFYGCKGLTSITIPESVTEIGSSAFGYCSSLKSIALPFVGNKRYKIDDIYQYPLGYIFGTYGYNTGYSATYQKYYNGIDFDNYDDYYKGENFYIPSSLKEVTITGSNYIPYGAFYNCRNLTSITIPESVTSIGGNAFYGCNNLTSFTIPKSVTSIGGGAFYDCRNLKSVTTKSDADFSNAALRFTRNDITYQVLNKDSVAVSSSYSSSYSGKIVIPETVIAGNTFNVTGIANSAFYNCSSLNAVSIPNSIATIGHQAFYKCTGLRTIVIPESVTSIGTDAFSGFSNIDYVVCKPSVPPTLVSDAFNSIDTIHVPIDYIDDYKTARIWKWKVILPFYKLRAQSENTTEGTVATSDSVVFDGHSATITATPNEGYHFVEWNDGSTEATRTINIININNYSFTAIFAINVYVINANNTQHGYIEGLASYEHGTTTTITAHPEGNYRFIRWSDGNTQNPRTITVTANMELNAIFEDEHSIIIDAAVPATCTETGLTEGKHCDICGEVLVAQQIIPAKGHTKVTSAAVAATCTETGLTAGKYCSECGLVFVAQQTVPAKGHTKVVDAAAVAPTCTEAGHTEGSHCSVCGTVLSEQTEIAALGHTVVSNSAVAATCTTAGYTSGSHCSVCGEILSAQTVIPALGHTVVTDPAVPATHTSTGLTAGSHCSVCGQTIVAQQVIPMQTEADTIYISNVDTIYIVQSDTIYNVVSKTDTIYINSSDTIYSIVNNYDTIYQTQIDTIYSVITKTDTIYSVINKVDTIYNIVNNYDTIYSTQVDTIYSVITKVDTVYNVINKVDTIYNIVNNYDTIYSTQIDTIYSVITKVDTVYNVINQIDTVYNIVNNYDTIYSTQIDTIYSVITKVDTVYNVINKVDTIYNIVNNYDTIYSTQIDTIYSVITKVDTVYDVINKVDTIYSVINTRDTVFSFASQIDTIYSVVNKVDTIYIVVNKVDTVYNFVSRTDTIYSLDTVYSVINTRDTVFSSRVDTVLIAQTDTVYNEISRVDTVYSVINKVDTVYNYISRVDTVYSFINSRDTVFYSRIDTIYSVTRDTVYTSSGKKPKTYNVKVKADKNKMGFCIGSGKYEKGEEFEIAAIPNYGYHFVRWNDGNTDNPREVSVSATTHFTAYFEINNYALLAAANEQEMGSVTGAASYAYLSRTTLKAMPNAGYKFAGWSDGETANPREVLVYSDTLFVAVFESEIDGHKPIVPVTDPVSAIINQINSVFNMIYDLTTDVEEEAVNEVHIYAFGNTIVVENADAEIFVYDAMGRLVCRNDEKLVRTELQINGTGVYIVKVGNVAKRVMIN
jgi:hypothetical protein